MARNACSGLHPRSALFGASAHVPREAPLAPSLAASPPPGADHELVASQRPCR
jgi:hypothetical protein